MSDEKNYIDEQPEEDGQPEHEAEHAEEPVEAHGGAAPAQEPETGKPGTGEQSGGYDPNSPKKWYIIHTYSGFENKVQESLRTRADAFGFADKIGQILIPTEEVVELRNGKKVTSKRLVYPGYVLVEMEMSDALWHEIKNTPRVTGFVGGGNSPVPLSPEEVNSILYRQASSAERPRQKMTFEKNDSVRIIDGPFANFSGKVDEVNAERGTLRVMVTIFGRATPVELEFLQVEKG
jgi:transcription termination/antitermination protein NusG